MNSSAITALSSVLLLIGVPAPACGVPPTVIEATSPSNRHKYPNVIPQPRMKISIGTKIFTAVLAENATAAAFKALLPLNLKMSDLHGNEKFFHLPSALPSNDANPGTIRAGDLMLWNSKSIVVFYKTFPTSYSYTRLGRILNPEELSTAVGTGDVEIRFDGE